MLRKTFILIILTLIISTTFIKNHTKNLDEKIFAVRENLNYLYSVRGLVQLEYDYLSSPEKLSEYNGTYFQNEFKPTLIENIIIISDINQMKIENLN